MEWEGGQVVFEKISHESDLEDQKMLPCEENARGRKSFQVDGGEGSKGTEVEQS